MSRIFCVGNGRGEMIELLACSVSGTNDTKGSSAQKMAIRQNLKGGIFTKLDFAKIDFAKLDSMKLDSAKPESASANLPAPKIFDAKDSGKLLDSGRLLEFDELLDSDKSPIFPKLPKFFIFLKTPKNIFFTQNISTILNICATFA